MPGIRSALPGSAVAYAPAKIKIKFQILLKMAYTSITKVREKCTQWATAPIDANITALIAQCDGFINSAAKVGDTDFTGTQITATVIEQISTDLAAYHCVAFDTAAYETNADARATADLLYETARLGLRYLADERVYNFIKTSPTQVAPYTTEAKVRYKCTQWATVPPQANIINFILHADGIINCAARQVFVATEAAGSLIEMISTNLAAYYCVAFDVSAFETNADAATTANLLYEAAQLGLNYLKDERVINAIKGMADS